MLIADSKSPSGRQLRRRRKEKSVALVVRQRQERGNPVKVALMILEDPLVAGLDLLGPRHRPARLLSDPECERGRVVLAGDAVFVYVTVEVVEPQHDAQRSFGR
jgi:hypothetical protein